MPPALPFPRHKHPPSTVDALGILSALPGGLPADQGDSAPIDESVDTGEEGQTEANQGEMTPGSSSETIRGRGLPKRP